MRILTSVTFAAVAACFSLTAESQPFYNGGGVALYNPIVDTVVSGTRLVVSPTVSADRKYVTLSTVAQASQVIKIESFPFFGINNAFAGGAGLPPADNDDARPTTRPLWNRQQAGLLSRPGMTFVGAP